MSQTLQTADRDFLSQLNQLESATIAELCDLQGVTTTAIRQRLNRLLASGMVERTELKQGRGRPQHAYRVSSDGKRLLGDNYSELAMILWKQIKNISDPQVQAQVFDQLRQQMIHRYGGQINARDLQGRIDQFQKALQEHGFKVEVDVDQEKISLKENNCPYHDLAVDDRSICDLEQTVFEELLGIPLQLTQRCVDGHNCCRFEHVELSTKRQEESV